MRHPLDGAAEKVFRATEQLETIRLVLYNFLIVHKPQPYDVFVVVDEDGLNVRCFFDVRSKPSLAWSVLIGEYVHDLRSALDHVLWQLVIHDGGEGHDRTQFPVFLVEKKFDHETTASVKDPTKWRGSMHGLKRESIALLRALQPFATGEEGHSPLWKLHQLSIHDKHRDLHLAGGVLHQVDFELPVITPEHAMEEVYSFLGPFEDRTLMYHGRMVQGRLSPDVKVNSPPTFIVVFGKESPVSGLPVVEGLNDIRKRVIDVIERISAECFETALELGV